MSKRHSASTISRARALFADGVSMAEISRSLGVHHNTVKYWARRDRKAGAPWSQLRRQRLAGSTRPLQREIADRATELLHDPDAPPDAHLTEERILKILKILEGCRKLDVDISGHLEALGDFAKFCARSLDPDDIPVIRNAVELYLDQMKRENS